VVRRFSKWLTERPPKPIVYREHTVRAHTRRYFDENLLQFDYDVDNRTAEICWHFKSMREPITLNSDEILYFIDVAIAIMQLDEATTTE